MSRDDPQLKIRLPKALKDSVVEAAEKSGRSINAEVVFRLEQSLQSNSSTEPQPIKIFVFENMAGVGISIELYGAVIGLTKNQIKDVGVTKNLDGTWTLSYQAVRCMIDGDNAKQLLDLGCTHIVC